jgi:hypothetical protein
MQRFKWTVIPILVFASWLSVGAYTLSALGSLNASLDPMPVFVAPTVTIVTDAPHS